MKILSFENQQALALQTEVQFRSLLEHKQKPLRGFFPTGRSPEHFYQLLRRDLFFWKQKFEVIQVDEFIGKKRLFYDLLISQVIEPLQLQDRFESIDPLWTDDQMQAHIHQVIQRPIDFALLGLGPNGHIGFHEPDQGDQNFLGGRVQLEEQSFSRVAGAPSRWALTFGAGSFIKAKKIILVVVGEDKRAVFENFKKRPPNPQLPATLLKDHPDLIVLTTLL